MISAKKYVPHWSQQVSVIKKVKNTVPWTYLIEDLNGEEIIGTFCERELQKTNLKEFRIKKVIKDYVKWKSCYIFFNSWIEKKIKLNKMICFTESVTN